jgi:hypothetical protein
VDHAFPPGYLDAAATAAAVAALVVLGGTGGEVVEVLLHVGLLVAVVVLEVVEGADPPLLDELVVAGELPGDFLAAALGGEVVLLVGQRLPDVFALHHVLGCELD